MWTKMPQANKALLCRDLVHSKCIMGRAWQQQEICLSYCSPEDKSHVPCSSSIVDCIITGTIKMFHSLGPQQIFTFHVFTATVAILNIETPIACLLVVSSYIMFGPLLCEKISKQILAGRRIRILSPMFEKLHNNQGGNNIPWLEEGLCTLGLDISHIHRTVYEDCTKKYK